MSDHKYLGFILIGLLLVIAVSLVYSHCQIPCGIYDDPARIKMLGEHITTIEKSMKQIEVLSKEDSRNENQIIRWVLNKEEHTDQFSQIITYYFMAQRIKPAQPDNKEAHAKYVQQITLLHKMLVTAMKCKQTTQLQHIQSLRSLLEDFEHAYLGEEGHTH